MSRVREFYGDGIVMIEIPGDTDDRAPGSSAALQFSDDSGTASTTKAISVKKAAELRGLDQGELAVRLREGKAKMALRDGALFVRYADLAKLTKQGKVPKAKGGSEDQIVDSADVEARTASVAAGLGLDLGTGGRATKESRPTPSSTSADPDPFAPQSDPGVDRRTSEIAKRLGIDIGDKSEPTKEEPSPDAAVQRISSKPRSRTRLGAPRRWGQR